MGEGAPLLAFCQAGEKRIPFLLEPYGRCVCGWLERLCAVCQVLVSTTLPPPISVC